MLATETMMTGPVHPSRGGNGQRLIMIVAPPEFLVECLAEVLRRRFPAYEVVIDDDVDVLHRQMSRIRLVLFYRGDTMEIAALLGKGGLRDLEVPVGVLIDDPGDLDQNLKGMAEEQRIDGILPLDSGLDVLLAGVELLMKGGEHFPSALLRRLDTPNAIPAPATHTEHAEEDADPEEDEALETDDPRLTAREVEILGLLCEGTQNKIIAHRLELSENTVKAHVRNIYKKLHVTNRTEAVMRYFDGVHRESGKPISSKLSRRSG